MLWRLLARVTRLFKRLETRVAPAIRVMAVVAIVFWPIKSLGLRLGTSQHKSTFFSSLTRDPTDLTGGLNAS
jgi:hypothetical protein